MHIRVRLALALPLLLVSTSALAQSQPTELRWVRGHVISNTAGVVLLQLQGDRIAIACGDPCAAATSNAVVELHYSDRNGELRGQLLFTGTPAAGDLSKKPGRSARGTLLRTKTASVELQVGSRKRDYLLEKRTTLIEADQPQPAARGRDEVITRLQAGDNLLVKYEEHDVSISVGEIALSNSEFRAVEVRRLR